MSQTAAQPAPPDAFSLLGLEARFDISDQELDLHQRTLNRAVHPDRHSQGSPVLRRQALSRAMDVNQAIRQVRDPIQRAELLLRRWGVTEAQTAPVPAELLMEMLEQREAVEQARRTGDRPRVSALMAAATAREETILARLRAVFEELGSPPTSTPLEPPKSTLRVLHLLAELRYVQRVQQELALIEEEP